MTACRRSAASCRYAVTSPAPAAAPAGPGPAAAARDVTSCRMGGTTRSVARVARVGLAANATPARSPDERVPLRSARLGPAPRSLDGHIVARAVITSRAGGALPDWDYWPGPATSGAGVTAGSSL